MTTTIKHTDGQTTRHETSAAALFALRSKYGAGIYLHDDGARTLVWASEEDSINDDGRRAVAEVRSAG